MKAGTVFAVLAICAFRAYTDGLSLGLARSVSAAYATNVVQLLRRLRKVRRHGEKVVLSQSCSTKPPHPTEPGNPSFLSLSTGVRTSTTLIGVFRFVGRGNVSPGLPEFDERLPAQSAVANLMEKFKMEHAPAPLPPISPALLGFVTRVTGLDLQDTKQTLKFSDIVTGEKITVRTRGLMPATSTCLTFHVESADRRHHFAFRVRVAEGGTPGVEKMENEVAAFEDSLRLLRRKMSLECFFSSGRLLTPLRTLSLRHVENKLIQQGEFSLLNEFHVVAKTEGTLEDLLRVLEADAESDRARFSITAQITSILDFLHGAGKGQPELHPKMFLIHESGAIVLDFDIVLQEGNDFPKTPFGNPVWMAPEVLQLWTGQHSSIRYDATVDAWPTGLILYKLWCGTLPFGLDDSKPLDNLLAVMQDALVRINSSELSFDGCPPIPRVIQGLIQGLLRKGWDRLKPGYLIRKTAVLRTATPDEIASILSDR
ncbi:hypothetical protein BESB_020840 [Besnoitia besnoiti]|uniref:Protein kinase domain-containing protein n=1 Tax=Besnoitia besnoiti TaxID=94643 RepID=A0A2A9M8X5_BESBE|nr:hypothetical protein BESB_020840 [Besnoitia besnoiti]PFH32143.1 hypothetical protein BESB_020840 [Besnoitia besnoiti]